MTIVNLTEKSTVYTSNVYYVTGTWKGMQDITTLIDAGMDSGIAIYLRDAWTGVGKRKVDQIILTHNHYDHAGMVMALKNEFHPIVLAWTKNHEGIDRQVRDGEMVQIADVAFEVIHMPGHSSDSIVLFNREEGVLFAGDSPLDIKTEEGHYEKEFIQVLERLSRLPVKSIYFGHGKPMFKGCLDMLRRSLTNVKAKS